MCVCACAAWHNTWTHTFFGGLQQQFFRSSQTQKTSSLWPHCSCEYVSPSSPLSLPFPRAVASRRDLLLQLYCAGNAFCALHFIAASICFCKQAPFPSLPFSLCLRLPLLPLLPLLPTYLPTYYSHSHRLSRGVKFVSPHTHTSRLVVHSHRVKWSLQGVYWGAAIQIFYM